MAAPPTDKDTKNYSLDNWRKVFSKKILHIGLNSIFCIEVEIKEVLIVDEYVMLTYDICLKIKDKCNSDDFCNYYDTLNNKFAFTFINNRLDIRIINIIEKCSLEINNNRFLLFADLVATEGSAEKYSAFILVPEFHYMKFIESCSKESVDKYLNNVKKKLIR